MDPSQPNNSQDTHWKWSISLPRYLRQRRERKRMRRYGRSFEEDLWIDGNDYLSQLVLQEGNNWKSPSN